MLRARGWKERGNTYVCAFCRNQLPPSVGTRRGRDALARVAPSRTALTSSRDYELSVCGARHLSTSSAWRNSNPGGNGSQSGGGGGFPRSFPGAASGGFGGFGAFGSGSVKPTTPSTARDGLLPHERAARQQSAPTPAAQVPPAKTAATPPARAANRGHAGSNRSNEQNKGRAQPRGAAEAGLSSVLANVFNKSQTPRPASQPRRPSDSNNGPARETTTAQNQGVGANSAPETRSRFQPTQKGSAPENRSRFQPTQRSPAAGQRADNKPQGWGSFSSRKATVSDPGPKFNDAFAQAFQGKRPDKPSSPKANEKSLSSFWDELESRAKSQNRQAAQDSRTQASRFGDNGSSRFGGNVNANTTGIGEQTNSVTGSSNGFQQENQVQERRSSRFDAEDQRERGKRSKSRNKSARASRYENDDDWDDQAIERWERAQQRKADKEANRAQRDAEEEGPTPIFLPEFINISNLAQALKQSQAGFLKDLEEMGFENVTSDTIMTGETAALIAAEYNFEPTVDDGSLRDLRPRPPPEDISVLPPRPPVVTIMGHVDHGKTTLLDWLRKSSVAAQEHGGITQHIGAFVVNMSSGKSITFLDTPGHAAFLSMRQRGANVTDIVVLVVAADDSVMPQTLEALKHARGSNVPIIVAINKIDKEDARIKEVKADLARHGVEIEDYGGDVQVVCVSGKTGQGMQDLEENIVTLSEVLDVRAETDGLAEGWVLESSIKQDGKTATVLVKRGTLRPGDIIVAGQTWAKIRMLRNEAGVEIDEAPPGTPAEILGWRELPTAGELILQSPDEGRAKTAVEYREEMAHRQGTSVQIAEQEQRQRDKEAAEAAAKELEEAGLEAEAEDSAPSTTFQNFTVKADVAGSVEAICSSIEEIGNNEVRSKILRSSAGQISEYDVDHAATSNSIIVNFNLPIMPHIKQLAEASKVKIIDHSVIYHVVDDVKSALSDLLPMSVTYRVVGEASILQIFSINIKKKKFKNIAGCRVRNGMLRRTSLVRVLRRGKIIFEGKVDTLKHLKKDITETGKGTECGIGLDGFEEFEVDDEIQAVEIIKEKRYL